MGKPLESFMQDLLLSANVGGHCSSYCRVSLVVDPAHIVFQAEQQATSSKRIRPDSLNGDSKRKQKGTSRKNRKSKSREGERKQKEPCLDVSDHGKRDSRWESSQRASDSQLPFQTRTQSPAVSKEKSLGDLSPVVEEGGREKVEYVESVDHALLLPCVPTLTPLAPKLSQMAPIRTLGRREQIPTDSALRHLEQAIAISSEVQSFGQP